MLLALAIFLLTYILISVQRFPLVPLDRPGGSMLGAVLMVLLGVITFDQAVEAIDFKTIMLLLGMMILVTYLALSGFFELVSLRLLRIAKSPLQLLALVSFSAGLLSALFVNDTIVLIYTPILLRALSLANLRPAPYLIALATSANIGSAVTIVGNPQNILVGVASGIPFIQFALRMLPIGVMGLLLDIAVIAFLYRDEIFRDSFKVELKEPKVDVFLLKKSLVVLAVVLVAFLVGESYISIPMAAISGAMLMLLIGGWLPARIFRRVDWTLLFFFANLFVVMHGVEVSGLTDAMFERFAPLFQLSGLSFIFGLSVFSTLVSNLVSNVPFVMMMLPFADKIAHGNVFWYTLAMSSTFAGNLTIVGSVANMIVVELSRRAGVEIKFWEFLRVGLPLTLLTIIMGSLVLVLY